MSPAKLFCFQLGFVFLWFYNFHLQHWYDLKPENISWNLRAIFKHNCKKNLTHIISHFHPPNSSLSESFIRTNKINLLHCHKRSFYVHTFFSFWWKCVLRNVICISTFYKKHITRVLVETEPALVFFISIEEVVLTQALCTWIRL